MTFFVEAVPATKPSSQAAFIVSQVAAAAVTITVLAQLVTFEDFPAVLSAYTLPGGYSTAAILAALIVSFEVLAVPFLLMMRLSPLMRWLSFACGVLSCALWLGLGTILITQGDTYVDSGLFGASVSVAGGWLPILFALIFTAGLAAAPRPSFTRGRR